MISLPALFSASLIALECTDTRIRAVHTRGRKERLYVDAREEEELPPGVIVQGEVKDPAKCVAVIRRVLAALRPIVRTNRVVLCIPPEKVYTFMARIPPCGEKERAELLRTDAAKALPENPDLLILESTVTRETKEQMEVVVAAIHRDVLRGYVDVLKEVPVEIVAITTIPAAIARASRAAEERSNGYLLVHAIPERGGGTASAKEGKGKKPAKDGKEDAKEDATEPMEKAATTVAGRQHTLTVFYHGAPIDEAVLPKTEDTMAVIAAVEALLTEYKAHTAIAIERVVVHADAALLRSLEDAGLGSVVIEEALPWLKTTEREWAGLIAASVTGGSRLPVNFFHVRRDGKRTVMFVMGAVLVGLIAGGAALLVRTLF